MKIGLPCRTTDGDRARVEAEIAFEDGDRRALRIFYEATGPLAEAMEPLPEAFAPVALTAAFWQGERRLCVEGPLDPTMAENLRQAAAVLASWHPARRAPTIETPGGLRPLVPSRERYGVALCSGGVDALTLLRTNLAAFPPGHPLAIRCLVYLFGATTYDFVDGVPSLPHLRAYERHARRLEGLAATLGLRLARATTSAAALFLDPHAYMEVGYSGLALGPVVACGGKVTDAHLGSSGFGACHPPHGSHPTLDPLWSTSATTSHVGQPFVSRHEKVGRIAAWELAYPVLFSCHHYLDLPEEQVNCGACPKCVRSMTNLVAWRALPRFTSFPHDDVTPAMIDAIDAHQPVVGVDFMTAPDLLEALRAAGRDDLVAAILRKDARRRETWWGRRWRKWRRSLRKRLGLR